MLARTLILVLLPLRVLAGDIALDNDYFRVARSESPCARAGAAVCGNRVIIALAALELESGARQLTMARGDIAVFAAAESYAKPVGGAFLEVAINPSHPPCQPSGEWIAAEKNALLYDGEDFFVFEEQLAAGDTRARHSHCPRLVVQLNATRLHQWPDAAPDKFVDTVPDQPLFAPAVVHKVSNIGAVPLRGIVVEFKPR